MPTYKFKEPNSKIKLNGKWYNESNLDSEVVSEILKYKPSFLGSVFIEVLETTKTIKNEIIEPKESVKTENNNEKAEKKSLSKLQTNSNTEAKQ